MCSSKSIKFHDFELTTCGLEGISKYFFHISFKEFCSLKSEYKLVVSLSHK